MATLMTQEEIENKLLDACTVVNQHSKTIKQLIEKVRRLEEVNSAPPKFEPYDTDNAMDYLKNTIFGGKV